MPALNRQPFPVSRVARIAWINGEIRTQHVALLALIPSMQEAPTARLQAVWESVVNRGIELRCLCAELEGLES